MPVQPEASAGAMRQALWGDRGIRLAEVKPAPLPRDWIRLRIAACGICGSDLHFYRRDFPPPPVAPGHEMVGYPIEAAPGLEDGLYAVEPLQRCGRCAFCQAGTYNRCPELRLFGLAAHGGLADFIDVPAYTAHRVDPELPAVVASLAEPLAVCVRATELARLEPSSRVLVLGAGTIGLLAGILARDRVARVAVTARYPHQQAAARRLGLEVVEESELAAWAAECAPDVVLETVGGQAETLQQALSSCRAGGRIVVVGVFGGNREINALALMMKEVTLLGSNMYALGERGSDFGTAVSLLPRLRGELSELQTHQFPLDELGKAFDTANDKQHASIKVTLIP